VWPMAGELFVAHPVEQRLAEAGCAVDPSTVRSDVLTALDEVLSVARLEFPDLNALESFSGPGGRHGVHTAPFEFLLAELQHLRSERIVSR
jgi:ring-1,2-phenylacetyl-CoA epoxidase subunit PaaC